MKLVTTLAKGLEILESFSIEEPRLHLNDIELKTGLPRATAYRMVRTLMTLGHVRYDPKTKEYYLGPKVMSLGYHVLSGLDLREIALPYLDELSRHTRHNVDMGILDGTEVIFIEHVKQRAFVNIEVAVGSRFKAYRTAMGRILLAHIAPGEFKNLLQEIRKDADSEKYIGSNGERLKQRLRAERREGYSLSDGEMYPGLRAAAAPLFNKHGEVDAAVAIVAFAQTCSMETLVNEHVPLLLETTRNISMSRGYMNGKRN